MAYRHKLFKIYKHKYKSIKDNVLEPRDSGMPNIFPSANKFFTEFFVRKSKYNHFFVRDKKQGDLKHHNEIPIDNFKKK